RAAGFTVGEDLSITSRISGGPPSLQAIRQAQAEAFAAKIRSRAAALAAAEQQVASGITTATASLSSIQFALAPVVPKKTKPSIQAVDNRILPQDPPPPSPRKPITSGKDVKDVLDALQTGRRKGVVTLPTADDVDKMFDYLTENASAAPPSDTVGHRECCRTAPE